MATNAVVFSGIKTSNEVLVGDIEVFAGAIKILTRGQCKEPLLRDCAAICAFLQSKAAFESFYKLVVDGALSDAYRLEKELYQKEKMLARAQNKLAGNPSLLKGGGLMRAFHRLMKHHGFVDLQGVVFTGNAGGFIETVKNKILFKDLTGPLHGEFTHSLQWLTICYLVAAPDRIAGHKFQNRVSDIYSKVIDIRIWPDTKSGMFPDELRFTKGAPVMTNPTIPVPPTPPAPQKTLWDFVVDCFAEKSPYTGELLGPAADLIKNLYTDSYRCPANIMLAIQNGSLAQTFIADWWKKRQRGYSLRQPLGKAHKWMLSKHYRPMVEESQKNSGRTQTSENTWKVTPQMMTAWQPANANTPTAWWWRDPDRENDRDEWDDDFG